MTRTERFPVKTTWITYWIELRNRERPVSLEQIARQYGVDKALVHRYTKKAAPGRKAPRKDGFNRQEAMRMEAQGMSRAAIARHFKVSPAAVTKALGAKMKEAA